MAKKTAREKQLDTLLRIRRLQEDLAKGELAKANAATRAAYGRLEASRATYATEVVPPQTCDVAGFRAHLARMNSVAGMVRGAERGVETAEEDAAAARVEVAQRRVKSQGLERLVDNVRAAAFAEMLAADQRTAEESRAGVRPKGAR
ncbi:MAG: hypothetical protein M9891_00335 [Austwickia sp.]|nr:hypothetical protein [Actinomycetota bacterium]MCB1252770.1 hypothetical protein [Austwickia sp.]MCO5307737.1 hypothetical protein [Austwickia sp.]